MSESQARSRNWCATTNNPTDEDREQYLALSYKYLVIGREHFEPDDEKKNTPHLQVYFQLQNPCSFASLRRKLPRAHLEKMRGTPQQAAEYCKKEGDYVEYGTLPQQGKRNDLNDIRETIKSNPSVSTRLLIEDHAAAFARFPRFVEACRKVYGSPNALAWVQSPNLWFFGPAGCGKSSSARSASTSLYVKMANKWWDGYDGEEDVLIDDFHPDQAKYLTTYLKIWADRYPFPAEVKCGSMFIRPKRIFVTTQYTMTQLFENGEDRAAIERRFSTGEINSFN